MELDSEILRITCELYSQSNFSRKDVQFVIDILRSFVSNVYNPFLLSQLKKYLDKAVSDEAMGQIHRTFDLHKDPFKPYRSEPTRLRLYKTLGLYNEPKLVTINTIPKMTHKQQETLLMHKPVSVVHLPLKMSLVRLLQLDGLFEALLNYMEILNNETDVLTNFIQGSLWKQQLQNLKKKVLCYLCSSFLTTWNMEMLWAHMLVKMKLALLTVIYHVCPLILLPN